MIPEILQYFEIQIANNLGLNNNQALKKGFLKNKNPDVEVKYESISDHTNGATDNSDVPKSKNPSDSNKTNNLFNSSCVDGLRSRAFTFV